MGGQAAGYVRRTGARVNSRQVAVLAVMLLGAGVRLIHLAFIEPGVPFRLGGLFAEFARQIAACGYRLPWRIPFYTEGGMPFAYPPLPFFVQAALLHGLGLPEFGVANALPPLVALLSLPVFWLLAGELGLSYPERLAALVAYATMPVAFVQQLEAAGLAESFGSMALLWLALAAVRAYRRRTVRSHLLVGVACAACVVSSPGSAYAALATVLILAVAELACAGGRPWARTAALPAVAGVAALAASSPYWATVVAHYGPGIFTVPFAAQHRDLGQALFLTVVGLVVHGASGAKAGMLWSLTVFGGIAWALRGRRWALLAWFAALLAIPREGSWVVAPAVALLAGAGAGGVFGPALVAAARKRLGRRGRAVAGLTCALLLAGYVLWCPFEAIRRLVADPRNGPSARAIAAMEWVKENTPADARFVALLPLQAREWTPHIARRTVLNMPYGSEWEPEEAQRIGALETRLDGCSDLDCVQASIAETMGVGDVYLFAGRDRLASLQAGSVGSRVQATFLPLWENEEVVVGRLVSKGAGP